jgi:hypothetical protein
MDVVDTLPTFLVCVLEALSKVEGEPFMRDIAANAVDLQKLISDENERTKLRPSERLQIKKSINAMRDVNSICRVSQHYIREGLCISERDTRYFEILLHLGSKLRRIFPHVDEYVAVSDRRVGDLDRQIDDETPQIVPQRAHEAAFDDGRIADNAWRHGLTEGWDEDWQNCHEAVTVLSRILQPGATRENWGDFFQGINEELSSLKKVESSCDILKYLAYSELLKSFVLAIDPLVLSFLTFEDLRIDINTGIWRRWVPARSDSYSRGPNLTSMHEITEDWLNLAIPEVLKTNLEELNRLGLISAHFSFSAYCQENGLKAKKVLKKQKKAISDRFYMPCIGFDQFREQLPIFATAMNWSLSEVYWCTSRPHHKPPINDHYEEGEGEDLSHRYNQLVEWYFRGGC